MISIHESYNYHTKFLLNNIVNIILILLHSVIHTAIRHLINTILIIYYN